MNLRVLYVSVSLNNQHNVVVSIYFVRVFERTEFYTEGEVSKRYAKIYRWQNTMKNTTAKIHKKTIANLTM